MTLPTLVGGPNQWQSPGCASTVVVTNHSTEWMPS